LTEKTPIVGAHPLLDEPPLIVELEEVEEVEHHALSVRSVLHMGDDVEVELKQPGASARVAIDAPVSAEKRDLRTLAMVGASVSRG
jgi:hypothetical protein